MDSLSPAVGLGSALALGGRRVLVGDDRPLSYAANLLNAEPPREDGCARQTNRHGLHLIMDGGLDRAIAQAPVPFDFVILVEPVQFDDLDLLINVVVVGPEALEGLAQVVARLRRHRSSAVKPLGHLVLVVDFDEESPAAMRHLSRLAEPFGKPLLQARVPFALGAGARRRLEVAYGQAAAEVLWRLGLGDRLAASPDPTPSRTSPTKAHPIETPVPSMAEPAYSQPAAPADSSADVAADSWARMVEADGPLPLDSAPVRGPVKAWMLLALIAIFGLLAGAAVVGFGALDWSMLGPEP
ncbi:MAG: hypothetical protein ACPGOV_05140 [Magnetovibrionaceae bacterium]